MGRMTAGLQSLAGLTRTVGMEGVLRGLLLRYRPELFFEGELKIELHENTWTMVSLSSRGRTRVLRLHKLFTKAPPAVLDAVVRSFFLREDRDAVRQHRARILDFVEANREMTLSSLSAQSLRSPRGSAYDLSAIVDTIRRKHLPQCPQVRIGWSERITPCLMGKWIAMPDGQPNLIVINRLLDSVQVPLYYLEYVVFHELLHELIPIRRQGGRWVHHPAEFRRLERKFPAFDQAVLWERANVGRLFGAYLRRARCRTN